MIHLRHVVPSRLFLEEFLEEFVHRNKKEIDTLMLNFETKKRLGTELNYGSIVYIPLIVDCIDVFAGYIYTNTFIDFARSRYSLIISHN